MIIKATYRDGSTKQFIFPVDALLVDITEELAKFGKFKLIE
jgi:hypothetical protein